MDRTGRGPAARGFSADGIILPRIIGGQGGGGGGKEPRLTDMYPDFWMPMIDTADVVAARK